jgi:hypothetical protein
MNSTFQSYEFLDDSTQNGEPYEAKPMSNAAFSLGCCAHYELFDLMNNADNCCINMQKARMYRRGMWMLDVPMNNKRYSIRRHYSFEGLALLAALPNLLRSVPHNGPLTIAHKRVNPPDPSPQPITRP